MDKALLEKALEMSPNERVVFAELILSSIDHEEDEIRELWLSEVKDRIKAVNEGKAKLLDFERLYSEDQNS
ncbi:MAG: addiction module protein [Candidatus Omnitrophica bacterium]|nr:addiction module protein [Candidatus Omnitrophota bacterium]MBI3008263.1 addiction module protein [Candidatus Omnitrophota bacterium]